MELEEALDLFDEILDLCYQIDDVRLQEVSQSIYKEVINAKDIQDLVDCSAELVVVLNEIDILEEDEEIIREIYEKIELLSE